MNLKQYIYKEHEVGVDSWPKGELRLDFDITLDPVEADLFVCPGGLQLFKDRDSLMKLPHFKGREARHVFLALDESSVVYDLPCMFLRANLKPWMLERDPNSMVVPWPVEDFGDCVAAPASGFKYDVSFHGWVGPGKTDVNTRARSLRSVKQTTLLKDVVTYPTFYGHQTAGEQARRRALYKQSLRESRVALCPESIPGDIPYRFYEALSAGRLPFLVSDGYLLPFADIIDWRKLAALHPTPIAESVGPSIEYAIRHAEGKAGDWVHEHARKMWQGWMDPRIWHQSFAVLIEHKLGQLGQTAGHGRVM